MFIDEKVDPNVSTFRPLPQQINSNIKGSLTILAVHNA
jgi:hypothetical protein